MELGEKIRQARQEAGLSQRQLCGEEITRNMLSQIENGSANPSMKTLSFLAARLEKPVSYFLEEEGPDRISRQLTEHMLLLNSAKEAIEQKKYRYAHQLLEKAGPGETPDLERRRLLLLGRIPGENLSEIAAALPSVDEELLLRAEAALLREDWERAQALLAAAEDQNAPRWHLLRGRALFGNRQYEAAAKYLEKAEKSFPAESVPLLEICFRELNDFRRAYAYACKGR